MSSLLEGIRILDLTNVLAGPFCCYQLALQGADVIKVEVPGTGDLARQLGADRGLSRALMGASFLAQNAGKRSVTVNMKSDGGKEVFRRLVASADVVVENFRPGVMERLGFAAPVLRAINPRLVYCAISGFGQDGPLSHNPAFDQIIQGLSGVMSITGDKASAPLRVGFPISDTLGGLTAAFAICAALVRRARTGEGEVIDVSMLESTIATMGWQVSNWLIAGVRPEAMGNENMTASPSAAFKTGDGLLNIAANQQDQYERLCKVIERPDLVTHPHYKTRDERKTRRAELRVELEKTLAARSAREWAKLLNDAGVPAGEVLSIPEILEHPQVKERKVIKRFANALGVDREVAVVRSGFRLASGDPEAATPPPALGADTDRLLAELGYSPREVAALRAGKAI